MALVQAVDPETYRKSRLAKGRSAGDVLVVRNVVLERVGRAIDAPQTTIDFAALALTLKRYASTEMDFAVALGLKSPGVPLAERRRLVTMYFGAFASSVVAIQSLLVVGAVLGTTWGGLAALVALQLQGLLATAGTPLRGGDAPLYAITRLLVDLVSAVGPAAKAPAREPTSEDRRTYEGLLAAGIGDFFEPPRDDCPVCRSKKLSRALQVKDRWQYKPGTFAVTRCDACGHLFQNPRLSIAGLDFYYRDFYDGLGEARLESMFASEGNPYLARAKMVASVCQPSRWLDVGAGHGHFCGVARDLWPQARFDGLDLSDSIEDAVRRRWVDRGYRGLFPDMAPTLAEKGERYDVVSMSHYLEHTRDPRAEIAAAAQVLPEGGLLFIEVPDPESRMGRILGKLWLPWFQPQHQHFLSVGNLERLLRESAFEPLVWHRGEAHQTTDFTFATYSLLDSIARPVDLPWLAPTTALKRVWHGLVWTFSLPFLLAAWLADRITAPLMRRPGWSNTYRVLARRTA
jgi:SAM-dependent methyltransferase